MKTLNYNHLYYFWMIANEGNLGRAAKALAVSQSALSIQLKKLEHQLDTPLFLREGRKLKLTEAGTLTLEYANKIFTLGNELKSELLYNKKVKSSFKIGVVSTLSRNFVENFIRPLLRNSNLELVIDSGNQSELFDKLSKYQLDIVLSNDMPNIGVRDFFKVKAIAKQPVSIIGQPLANKLKFDLFKDLTKFKLLLPSKKTELRTAFDNYCDTKGLKYEIMAEINDMPALRLLTRDSACIALMPKVVVQDEIKNGTLEEYCHITDLFEKFYAIYLERNIESDILKRLLNRESEDILNQ